MIEMKENIYNMASVDKHSLDWTDLIFTNATEFTGDF